MLSADGTQRRWFGSSDAAGVTWSPDSRMVAYVEGRTIVLFDIATQTASTLVSVDGGADALAWSPDGTEIAFGSGYELHVVDVRTRRQRTLTESGDTPVWSPDGTRIAFSWFTDDFERELWTIARDGRDVRRVDSARDTSDYAITWCLDSRTLVFTRPRSAGPGSDVWLAAVDGSAERRVTRAFPSGADFEAPSCAATTVADRATPPSIVVSPSRVLATRAAVVDLAADRRRVAYATRRSCVAMWSLSRGTAGRGRCTGDAHIETLAIAGQRAAWISLENLQYTLELEVVGPRGRASVDSANQKYTSEWIGNLAGDGAVLVYNSANRTRRGRANMRLWRVVGTGTRQLLASGPSAFEVTAVDADRIAVLRSDGRLVLLNSRGNRLAAFPLGRNGIDRSRGWPLRLAGSRLIVFRGATIEVRDAARGTVRHAWPTARSDLPLTLEDADATYAVYTAGIEIHVIRLSDGRDRVIGIADQEGPAHAELEPEGLYYSYNTPGGANLGRVAFVRRSALTALFDGA